MEKILKEYKSMMRSRDIDDLRRVVKVNDRLSIAIEMERVDNDEDGYVYDEDGKIVTDLTASPVAVELYALVDGEEVDCCSLATYSDPTEDINYLISCYSEP